MELGHPDVLFDPLSRIIKQEILASLVHLENQVKIGKSDRGNFKENGFFKVIVIDSNEIFQLDKLIEAAG